MDRSTLSSIALAGLFLGVPLLAMTAHLGGLELGDDEEPWHVYESLNTAGFQKGSVFTNSSVSTGNGHTCAILGNGSLACWGDDSFGQLGTGSSTDDETEPVLIDMPGGLDAVEVSAGNTLTCAILEDGFPYCWGDNTYYALGNGQQTSEETPVAVLLTNMGSGRKAVEISAGFRHACAIFDDGSLGCWGVNGDGQLGLG